MSKKIVINNGTLEEVSVEDSNVLNRLAQAIGRVKRSIKNYEDTNIRVAGIRALRAAEFGLDTDIEGPDADDADMGMSDDDVISDAVETIEDAAKEIKDAIGEGEGLADEAEGEIAGGGKGADEMIKLTMVVNMARDVIANAKTFLKSIRNKESVAGIKGKIESGEGSGKAMDIAMGKSGPKGDKKDKGYKKDKGEKKEDTKDDSKEKEDTASVEAGEEAKEEKKSSDSNDLVRKIKARLQQLREEKEANLYPFKDLAGAAAKVDNTNAETAKKTISTVNSEIKKQPVKDKAYPTINQDGALKDLPVKSEGKNTSGKSVSLKAAEKIRQHSVENAVNKARLSVELASQQQLKGLIADPLKEALVKNLSDVGISEDAAKAIVHNAYIDAYEDSHKAIIKEAFDTFINKDLNDFVNVAKFVKNYTVREADEAVSEETRQKEASDESVALRPSQVDKKQIYKDYWTSVAKERIG